MKLSYDEKYVFADGKKRSYFSKANYVSLIPDQGEQQYSVRQLLSPEAHPEITEDDYYKFASAAILSPSGDCSISVHPDASGVTFQPPSSSDSEHVSTPSAAYIAGPSGSQRDVGEEAGPHRVRMCQLLML